MPQAAPTSGKPRYYQLQQIFLKQTPPGRSFKACFDCLAPWLQHMRGPCIVLEALAAPQMPQWALLGALSPSAPCRRESEHPLSQGKSPATPKGEDAGKPSSSWLLRATHDAAELLSAAVQPRLFELRLYHAPAIGQLAALHERLAGPAGNIFQRAGIHPVLYGATLFGATSAPHLLYLIPFDSLAARQKAWNAFAADAEWIRVRREFLKRHGQMASLIQIVVYQRAESGPSP